MLAHYSVGKARTVEVTDGRNNPIILMAVYPKQSVRGSWVSVSAGGILAKSINALTITCSVGQVVVNS